MNNVAPLALLVLTFGVSAPSAQTLNNCGGVITNRPCSEGVTPKPVTMSDEATTRSKKSLILHDLTMKSLRAKRDHEVDVDISQAKEVCSHSTTTIEQCREAAVKLDDRIEDRITARAPLEAARKLAEKSQAVPTPMPSGNSSEVVIINNVRVYRDRHPHDPWRPDWHDHDHDHEHGIGRGNWQPNPATPPKFEPPPPVPRPGRMKLPTR